MTSQPKSMGRIIYNYFLCALAAAIVWVIWAYMYYSQDRDRILKGNSKIIFDGSCSIPQSQEPIVGGGKIMLTLECIDKNRTHVQKFNISYLDLLGSKYIFDHPGSKVHCTISADFTAHCDVSTSSPSDP